MKKPEICEACGGKGYLVGSLPGGIHNPENEIERCDACEFYATDTDAREVVETGRANDVADRIHAMELDVLLRLAEREGEL